MVNIDNIRSKSVTAITPILLAIGMFLAGWFSSIYYSSQSNFGELHIIALGPDGVHSGKAFNVQPDGTSAIWVKVSEPVASDARIVLGGRPLLTQVASDILTATVPAELYSTSRVYEVKVIDSGRLTDSAAWIVN
jgi:hypothetical protein